LPLTRWIDPQRVIRQALIGSIRNRRNEVVDSTARLMRLVRHLEEHPSQPPPGRLIPKRRRFCSGM